MSLKVYFMRKLNWKVRFTLTLIDSFGYVLKAIFAFFKRDSLNVSLEHVKNILVFEPWGLGDLVIATYFFPCLRRVFPEAKIFLICSPSAEELMINCPYVDKIIAYKFQWTKSVNKYSVLKYDFKSLVSLILDMRKIKFDIALSGRPDPRNNFFFWLVGAKYRIGFGSRGGGFFLTKELGKEEENKHAIKRWEAVLRTIGCTENPVRHLLWLTTEELQEADQILADAGITKDDITIGIHWGASNPQRKWPTERFGKVAERISRHSDVKVLFFFDPNYTNMAFPLNAGVILPKVNIRILAALLSKVVVLLCNDSGPMHLAAAVGTPVVALFGRSDPSEFGPLGLGHTIIEASVNCRPCYVECKYSKPKCWDTITVSEVTAALESKISELRILRHSKKQTISLNDICSQ